MGARTRGLANNVLTGGKIDATDGVSGVIDEANIANSSLTSATTFGSVSGGVSSVSSDPPSPSVGNAWYNTTAGTLKFRADIGSWSSGGNVNTTRAFGMGAGTTDANLYYGGSAAPTYYAQTELYNGTSWTEVADLNTYRGSAGGMGTSTAALCAGGRVSPPTDTAASEEWDGSSWTEGNDLNSERYSIANKGAGTQTAGLCAGGRNKGPGSYDALTEEYDGTSWTEVNDMPAGVESASGLGTQTAAGVWGGYTGSYRATGVLYDGTNWTTTTDFPVASGSASESGTTSAGLLFGIYNSPADSYVADTLSWDGTNFSGEGDLSTARGGGGGPKAALNSATSGIMVSGKTDPGTSNATEEWAVAEATTEIGGTGISSGSGY